jgi:hypothetical protein
MADITAELRSRLQDHQDETSKSLRQIAQDFDLGYSWLSKFARGERCTRPSFELITRLQVALDRAQGAGAEGRV